MSAEAPKQDVFANLRQYLRPRPVAAERCELCGTPVGPEHPHLLEMKNRKIACSCSPCALLFGSGAALRYKPIPRDIFLLTGFEITDAQWEGLGIPINMAFFCHTLAGTDESRKPSAYYPSPAGATESLLDLETWEEIAGENPQLSRMQDEVEALLVNRVTVPYEYYLVPIDQCFALVGLIRKQWRGFSGGADLWKSIAGFFASLKERARPARGLGRAES